MRLKSIQSKVLLLFLLLTVVLLLAMSVMVRYGFNQQFNAYKQNQADRLNQNIVTTLQNYYQQQGSWDELEENPRLWSHLLVQSATNELGRNGSRLARGKQKKAIRSMRESQGIRRMLPQFSLIDPQNNTIVGALQRPINRYVNHPVVVDGQRVASLLAIKPGPARINDDPKLNQGIKVFLWTLAVVMLVITLFATWPIARYFSKPIKSINQATKKAAAGDYSARAAVNRNDELGQLGQNFNLLTSTLQSNADIQKKMMADISHELRTPVAVLQAQIEAIQDGIHQADDKNLSLLHQQVTALARLIQDLHQLSVSDLGSMQYQMQATQIKPIIESALSSQELAAADKNISIKTKTDTLTNKDQVMGDGARLQQMLVNLLANSVAYTNKGGQIELHASEDKQKGDYLIKITDSEPGLLPHEMDQMFDRLYRHEASRNKQSGGSGLGLAIVKNIVQAHGGHIEASASKFGGVCMTLRIPKHV